MRVEYNVGVAGSPLVVGQDAGAIRQTQRTEAIAVLAPSTPY